MNLYSETNSLGTLAAFIQPLLYLLEGEGGWGTLLATYRLSGREVFSEFGQD